MKSTAIYARINVNCSGTDHELVCHIRARVEVCGGAVVGLYTDDAQITGKGKNAGWRRLLANLQGVQQVALADVADLPAKTVNDLLTLLTVLTEHGVTVVVPHLEIDTDTGQGAVLTLIQAFRRARWTETIRAGQNRVRAMGVHIGRPPVPISIRHRIVAALNEGCGVRPTAKRFNVSPAFVVAIRHEMQAKAEQQAA